MYDDNNTYINNINNIIVEDNHFNWNEIFNQSCFIPNTIPLDKFIEISLYNNRSGYYINKNPIGKDRDFYTAPDLSNLFGETIAVFIIDEWVKHFNNKKIRIVELGGGTGKMMYDIISVIQRLKLSEFFEYYIYEINPLLKLEQGKIFNNIHDIKCGHISNLDRIYDISQSVIEYPLFFISNEFFDVLPIKQYKYTNSQWYEKNISFNFNNKELYINDICVNKLNIYESIYNINRKAREGDVIEYSPMAIEYINTINKNIQRFGGMNLIIDYGYMNNEFRSTIRGYKKHQILDLNDILNNVFECDITADVNFNLLYSSSSSNGKIYKKFCSQRDFLIEYGILDRMQKIKNTKKLKTNEIEKIELSINTMLDACSMGNKFKILYM